MKNSMIKCPECKSNNCDPILYLQKAIRYRCKYCGNTFADVKSEEMERTERTGVIKHKYHGQISLGKAKDIIKYYILHCDRFHFFNFWMKHAKRLNYGKRDNWIQNYFVDIKDYDNLNDFLVSKLRDVLCKYWRQFNARNCIEKYEIFEEIFELRQERYEIAISIFKKMFDKLDNELETKESETIEQTDNL